MLEMSSTTTNWLAFSLSSHHGQEQVAPLHLSPPSMASSSPLPYTFFLPSDHRNAGHGSFYAADDETETRSAPPLYDPSHDHDAPLLPLNSDGSLFIFEGFNRTHDQGMGPSQSPKLEDFMGTHQVQRINNEKEDMQMMPLNLDTNNTTYFIQNPPENYYLNHMPNIAQNLNYFLPLDWTGYNVMEQNINMASSDHTQFLNLSMSNGSHQSVCGASSTQLEPEASGAIIVAGNEGGSCTMEMSKKKVGGKSVSQKQSVRRKCTETFGHRTSQYRGVTRHRWTGRYEAHLWDNSCKKEGQARKGRQVYLGGYDSEEKAARAYDLAALKYWGPSTSINLPVETYKEEIEEMKSMTRQEFIAHIRRRSSGFSRGASIYRGVTRHHQHGRWQARIGRVSGNKDLYLGTFSTQEEAAEAYDIAAIKFRGITAVTNFDINRYDVDQILSSNVLLPIDQAKKKTNQIIIQPPIQTIITKEQCDNNFNNYIHFSNSSSLVTSLSNNSGEATNEHDDSSVFWDSIEFSA